MRVKNPVLARKMLKRRKAIRKEALTVSIKDFMYLIAFILISIGFMKVLATNFKVTEVSGSALLTPTPTMTIAPKPYRIDLAPVVSKNDARLTKLTAFLKEKNSPLMPFSELIIAEADKYDIGWTKIVAISGIESNFGKALPLNSHNAWGIGGSDFMYFKNWEEGIQYVSKMLSKHYKDSELRAIKAKYCPISDGCNPEWTSVVANASNAILNK